MANTNNTSFNDNLPGLKIDASGDGTIMLEQEWAGNVDRVAVHAVHVRHLAEKLGLVCEVSESDAELLRTERGLIADLRKENDRLKRNMLRLRAHALDLQRDFVENADWKHADLTHEMNNINALVDLMDMAVDDFVDDYTPHETSGDQRATKGEPLGSSAKSAPARTDGLQVGAAQSARVQGTTGDGTTARTKARHSSDTPAASAPPQEMRPADAAPLATAPLQLDLED